jgi:hypothetical protein
MEGLFSRNFLFYPHWLVDSVHQTSRWPKAFTANHLQGCKDSKSRVDSGLSNAEVRTNWVRLRNAKKYEESFIHAGLLVPQVKKIA